MNSLRLAPLSTFASPVSIHVVAHEAESPWEARGLTDLVPPATLIEARARRDELTALLGRERAAAADFLLALADFDRRRGWEQLGHASLFAFLTRELDLSSGAAQLRLSAARLLPRHRAVEAALRSGRLCISAVGQLARVLTPENEGAVLPRFFGRSAREAAELAATLLPRAEPPTRTLVTPLPAQRPAPRPVPLPAALLIPLPGALLLPTSMDRPSGPPAPAQDHSTSAPPRLAPPQAPLHTCEVPAPERVSAPHQEPPRRPEVEPLTAALRRLHLTVSKGFLEKIAAARTGLSHALPRATTEQVLEAALDLLLERQARRKALVKRPRKAKATTSTPSLNPVTPPLAPSHSTSPWEGGAPPDQQHAAADTGARPHVPADVEREVRLRDGDRCQFPLDAGGVCGSTWQVQLDHVLPLALGGPTTAANLRCACAAHNRYAALLALGPAAATTRRRRGPGASRAAGGQARGGGGA